MANCKYQRIGCLSVIAVYTLAIAGCLLLICGCTTTKYVPVETTHTEYKDREVERIVTDTISDTRFVYVKGDTIVDIRYKERVRIVQERDTCVIERIDSVQVPYPVERELSRWERVKMDLGGIALGGLIFAILAIAIWLVIKFRKV